MRLAVGGAAGHDGAGAGGDGGVEEIDVEADVQVHAALAPAGDALGQQRRDAALVDLPHVDGVDAVGLQARLLARVDRAGAEDVDVRGLDRRGTAGSPSSGRRIGSPARNASAMPCMLPLGRGLGGVVVGMGVEPEHGELAALLGAAAGDAADRAHGDGVVAAEEDRHPAALGHAVGVSWSAARPAGDLGQVPAALGVARLHRHAQALDLVQGAAVRDAVAEVGEDAREPGGAQRLRAHQGAARGGAELEAGAEDRMSRRVSARHRGGLKRVEHVVSICG